MRNCYCTQYVTQTHTHTPKLPGVDMQLSEHRIPELQVTGYWLYQMSESAQLVFLFIHVGITIEVERY